MPGRDGEPRRTGRPRLRLTVGSMLLALVVLVGCGSSPDGQVVVPTSGSQTSIASSSESESGSAGTDSSASETTSGTADSTGAGATTAQSSAGEPTTTAPVTTSAPAGPSSPSTTARTSATTVTNADAELSTTFTGNPDNLPVTEPGKQLRYGEPATLPMTFADQDGVFTLSNLTVTKGSDADWATLGVDPGDSDGQTPWYLKLNVKQIAGGDFTFSSIEADLWAYTAAGDSVLPVFVLEYNNPICPVTGASDNFKVGDSYDTCLVLSVTSGESVDRIQYEGDYSVDGPYSNAPVVWKAG